MQDASRTECAEAKPEFLKKALEALRMQAARNAPRQSTRHNPISFTGAMQAARNAPRQRSTCGAWIPAPADASRTECAETKCGVVRYRL